MLKEMNTRELLNIQTSVDTQDNEASNLNINAYEIVDDTPFVLVKQLDKWIIVMGDQKVSINDFDNKDDAKKYIAQKPWELILVGSYIYGELIKKEEEQLNNRQYEQES